MLLPRRSVVAALAAAPLAARLRGSTPAAAQAESLRVLATFSILGDVVRAVGGQAVALEVLVGPDTDAHTFEPSPEDIARIAEAALLFENGLGFEEWLGDVFEASGSGATRVAVAEGVPTLLDAEGRAHGVEAHGEAGPHAEGEGEHAEGGDHDHGDTDPHVWHDVRNVVAEVAVIRDALSAVDPANAAAYTANAGAYAAELEALHTEVGALAATLPAEHRRLVTSHDSLGYLAAAYGFEVVGTALGSLSTETADPSAGEIAALVEETRAAGVPAIFAENTEGSDLMAQVAEDAGVALAPPLYTNALSGPDGPAADYVSMVRHNMATIVAALGA